jgi:hypothetical protein
MEGCGDDAMTRHGGPREPQPAVTHAPQSAALGQAVVAFRMLKAPSIVGADGAEPTRKRRAPQGAARAETASNRWLVAGGLRIP